MSEDPIEFSWQSTPQLWCAHRNSYDGAPDSKSRNMLGFGRTKEEAAAELIEKEDSQGD